MFISRGALVPDADAAVACCATTATARSPTSPRRRGCSARSNSTSRAGPITTTTAGSTSSSSASSQSNRLYHNRGDGTFEEVAGQGRRLQQARQLYLQGCRLDRLRQRRLSGPVRQQPERRRPAAITTIATAPSPTSPSRWASTGPSRASRAGPGTTTTTAGSTSSPPAYDDSLEDVVKGHDRPAAQPTTPTGSGTT